MELSHFRHWVRDLRQRHVRRVFRAVVSYGIVAFALVEVTEPVTHALHLPEWTLSLVVVLLGLGFPVVAVVAWISPGVPEADPAQEPAAGAEAPHTPGDGAGTVRGRLSTRGALLLAGIGLLVAAPGLVYYFLIRARIGPEAVGGAAVRSIAVLPFQDLSPGKDQEYFADGVAEEIHNALVHVDGLRVAGRASSFYFKGKSATIAEIGRELHVRTLLSGSVRKDGSRVRVTAEVIDVAGGEHVWSESYDRELTGIFVVQDEIARAVVEALKVKMSPGIGGGVKKQRPTNAEAYNAYLFGRHFFDLGTADDMGRAVAALEKAIALDPDYAPAWAWLSVAVLNSAVYLSRGGSPAAIDHASHRALDAADRAVALGPDLAESWSARGWMRTSLSWDWAGARDDFQRALSLNPRDPNILLRQSHLLAVLGQGPEAIAVARKVIEIDPLYAWAWTFLAGYYDSGGRPELGRDAARRALDIAPDHLYAQEELGIAHLLLREPREALGVFQRNRSEVIRLAGSTLAQHDLGNAAEERKSLDALRDRFGETEPYELARVHAWRGDRDDALSWLERAVKQRGGRGYSRLTIRRIFNDPLLRNVRDDPRYAAVLRTMNLTVD